ncbi:2,3-bisphosphoglycerate-dependent phosphoglycerate mutase [Flammeovirgaceae bacterium SG7u.111]|nr:2,3-bisphosphoglycerate-dependent phosphoglycerate mutase [Flammeovirgaceae bacterium SG7u.132]WPO34869.1 2,3-bisphosphoglycerate-dependent phosphoglycerate mutase [Flammeovirgaceae bacterium SG7u.111]
MANLVILRHGKSLWNIEHRFTGTVDIKLSPVGVKEAEDAADRLRDMKFDAAFTSSLSRAKDTLQIMLGKNNQLHTHIKVNKALNPNYLGDLEGQKKEDLVEKFGASKVRCWQKSYSATPPNGESLLDISNRIIDFYEKEVIPLLKQKKNVLLVAHGNSLRALMMYLESLTPESTKNLNLPTAQPILYKLVSMQIPEPAEEEVLPSDIQDIREYMVVSEKVYV